MNTQPLGLINFRDFGGYATASGATVRKDRLYRCGHLADLTDDEIEHVIGLDFALIADLRYVGEREAERSPWPSHYVERIFAHDGDRSNEAPHLALYEASAVGVGAVEDFYLAFNRELPFDPLYRPLFARVMRQLAETDGRALVHCAAGKDRTGLQSALILHALGVPHETIVADYLKSSKAPGLVDLKPRIIARFEERYDLKISEPAADALLDVKADYIQTAFASIVSKCGSVEAYLAAEGVDEAVVQGMRERLLTA